MVWRWVGNASTFMGQRDTAFTIAMYGDSGVGKSYLTAMLSKTPVFWVKPTKGFDISISSVRKHHNIRWVDTSGSPRWTTSKPWIRRLDLVVLVFAIQNRVSWLNVRIWMQRIQKWHSESSPPIIVVGMDHGVPRVVSKRTVVVTLQLLRCPYFEVSPKRQGSTGPVEDLIELYADGSHRLPSLSDRFASGAVRYPIETPQSSGCFGCVPGPPTDTLQ